MKKRRMFNCLFQKSGNENYKLFVNDAIYRGTDWDGNKSETSASYFAEKLAEIPAGATLEVHINSEGGDAFEGTAIYNQLKSAPIKTIGIVDGRAFSAATFILMACDERIMQTGTVMLVHNAWTVAMGNAEDLRAVADDLDKLMEANHKVFLERCSLTEEELIALMAEDRLLSPEEALKYGFIDRIGLEKPEEDPEDDPDDNEEPEENPDEDSENNPEENPDDNPDDDPDEDEDGTQAIRSDRMAAMKFFRQFY